MGKKIKHSIYVWKWGRREKRTIVPILTRPFQKLCAFRFIYFVLCVWLFCTDKCTYSTCGSFSQMSVHTPHVCPVPMDVSRGNQIFGNWHYGWSWVTIWVLWIIPRFSERTSALKCWATSLPFNLIEEIITQLKYAITKTVAHATVEKVLRDGG